MRSLFYKCISFSLLLMLLAVLFPQSALADPYPGSVSVSPYDENTIQVSWSPNVQADGYRVYRNSNLIAETDPNTTEYMDTNLSPGTAYWYGVATMKDGQEYMTGPVPAAWTVPLTAPVLEVTDWAKYYDDSFFHSMIFRAYLTWSEVQCASGYHIYVSKDGGPWEGLFSTSDISGFGDTPTTDDVHKYSLKVRAYNEFWYVVSDEGHKTWGPFSEPVDVYCINFNIGLWKELFKIWKGPPWPEPWHQEWILSLLTVYGDTEKWPAGAGVEELAELVQCLMNGSELTPLELRMQEAIHPHGLALLIGAYAAPPDRAAAHSLAEQLQEVSRLMAGHSPESLEGKALEGYLEKIKGLYGLVALSGDEEGNLPYLQVIRPADGRIILGAPFRMATPAPAATPTLRPIIQYRFRP